MHHALIYHPGELLSPAELSAARLDGHVVEVGPAYMPFDTLESTSARAAAFRPFVAASHNSVALVGRAAAWVHGAPGEAPVQPHLQRISASFTRPAHPLRYRYVQQVLPTPQRERIGELWISTPERTLLDLCRRPDFGGLSWIVGLLLVHEQLASGIRPHLGELGAARLEQAILHADAARRATPEAMTR